MNGLRKGRGGKSSQGQSNGRRGRGVHGRSRAANGSQVKASKLLSDFRESVGTSVTKLPDIAGHVVEFASDQVCCLET